MSLSMTPENVFRSALQPNSTVSTYAVPSQTELAHGGTHDEARFKRVQQQVSMRLAEKSTLPRHNGSASQYAASESGTSTMTKYQTQNFTPNFSSKSYVYSASRPVMAQRASQYSSGGYSSRSAIDFAPKAKMSYTARGGGGGAGAYYQEEQMSGGYQGGGFQGGSFRGGGFQVGPIPQQQVNSMTRSFGRMATDDTGSVHSMRVGSIPRQAYSAMMAQDDSDGSISERDAMFGRQASVHSMSNGYVANTYPRNSMYSTSRVNGYESGQQQVSSMTLPPLRRSLSSTFTGDSAGGAVEQEVYVRQQQSFKGPAYRTINRINNRHQVRGALSSSGSMYGSSAAQFSGSQSNLAMSQGRLSRAGSVRSMHSVGRGRDVFDGMDMEGTGNLSGLSNLDLPTAMSYLVQSDPGLQMLGAAYIQHECYHNKDAKEEVYKKKGFPLLVRLINNDNEEVQRYATGAIRNLIFQHMENKGALIEANGISELVIALENSDDELRKNITGILWNLSSKDHLKDRLARETLPKLTELILIPLSGVWEPESDFYLSPSQSDIFYNTTGCLRNLSSTNQRTRDLMRRTEGLVDALVKCVQKCSQNGTIEEKGVENAVCVLRNLSYQLYNEIPENIQKRLEGPTRASGSPKSEPIGCFTPQSRKAKDRQNQDLFTFSEVSKRPRGMEWLWHPQIVDVYNMVLQQCESNSTTREAAVGALQNITSGDKRWASIMSRVALEEQRMLPTIMDLFKTNSNTELRSLTGFLRNLSRHAKNKDDMATKVIQNLIIKLPIDGNQKDPSDEVVLNICSALNNLVTGSSLAARDIAFFDGLPKLIGIKTNHDDSPNKQKSASAAATVLNNMFQYKKLHKEYKNKGYTKQQMAI